MVWLDDQEEAEGRQLPPGSMRRWRSVVWLVSGALSHSVCPLQADGLTDEAVQVCYFFNLQGKHKTPFSTQTWEPGKSIISSSIHRSFTTFNTSSSWPGITDTSGCLIHLSDTSDKACHFITNIILKNKHTKQQQKTYMKSSMHITSHSTDIKVTKTGMKL